MPRLAAILALIFLLLPAGAGAAAPEDVTGIRATPTAEGVRVRWTAVDGAAEYRVFYSHVSILENDGLYDDFESTNGPVTELVIKDIPPVDELFIAVLAVNAEEEESALFLEEATVSLNGTVTPPAAGASSSAASSTSSKAPPPPAPNAEDGTFRLLAAETTSATGVLALFSHPIVLKQEDAANAFVVKNGSGETLRITRIVIEGKQLTLHTAPQERGRAYQLKVGSVVRGGKEGNEQGPALEASQAAALFLGHESGVAPAAAQATNEVPGEVRGLRLRATPLQRGYTIEAQWQPPADPQNVLAYRVFQTSDGGKTWNRPTDVPGNAGGITVAGVPPVEFAVLVQVIRRNGTITRGLMQPLSLVVKQTPPKAATPASVLPDEGTVKVPVDSLADSGFGIPATIAVGGMVLGWATLRRRRASVAG